MKRLYAIRVLAGWLALLVCAPAQQYVFQGYQQNDGLKNLVVKKLAMGRFGLLWVATENGVYRFLGSDFERFGPERGVTDVDIQDIYSDPYGMIWVGVKGNLLRWTGTGFVPAGSKPIHIQGAQRLVAEDAQRLLVVDGQRLYRLIHESNASQKTLSYAPVFSDRLLVSHPELGQISSVNVVENQSGNEASSRTFWMGCGGKLCSWRESAKGGAERVENTLEVWGKDKGLPEDSWLTVLAAQDGAVWVAGQHHLACLPRGATRFEERDAPGAGQQDIHAQAPLAIDRLGRVLTANEDRIYRLDGKAWRMIDHANGLRRGGHINSLIFDGSGDPWIGSNGLGLIHWVGYEDWEGWDEIRDMVSVETWSIFPSRNRVYVGTQKGLAWINPENGSSGAVGKSAQWTFGQVSAIGANRDGSLWVGTFSGNVLRVNLHTGGVTQTGKLPALLLKGVQDAAGRVYFVSSMGIYQADQKGVPQRVAAVDALVGGSMRFETGCVSPDGSLWFLGKNRILHENNGLWTAPFIEGLPKLDNTLLAMSCAVDGSLWVTGAQTGTWRLTSGNERLRAWKLELPLVYSPLAPLAILADRRGWIWLGTDQGVLVWNGQSWRHLTQESGLIWNDVNQGVMANSMDGSLWVGTTGGVSHLMRPEHVFRATKSSILISGIQRDKQRYSPAQKIALPWSKAPLRIRLATSTTRNRSELSFRYRLSGLQSDWINTRESVVVLSTLPPGKYTFQAMIRNPGLGAASDVASVEIRIFPPWWRSYWFYALCGLVIAFLLYLGMRLRERQIHFRSKQLERLVRERTHELELSREQLRIQATHDELTGMLNREAVLRVLTAEMDRARRESRSLIVSLVDLDHFKQVNDTYGHLAGDEALRWFAAAVGSAIRAYDHAGRYGGEEFLLILTEVPREAVEARLNSLHASISNLHVRMRGLEFTTTCSIGATIFDTLGGASSVESLLAVADRALYAAKAAGRNCVKMHDASSQYSSANEMRIQRPSGF